MNELLEDMCVGCSENRELRNKIKAMCLHFFSLIQTIPKGINIKDSNSDDITLWSGRNPDEISIPDGADIIELPTFISTTINPNVAYEFSAEQKNSDGKIEFPVWKIRVPNVKRAQFKGIVFSDKKQYIDVLDDSARDLGELEVLIPPFSRFKVIRQDEIKNIVIPEKYISFAGSFVKVSEAFTKRVRIYELEYIDYNETLAKISYITSALQPEIVLSTTLDDSIPDDSITRSTTAKKRKRGGKRIKKQQTKRKRKRRRKSCNAFRYRKNKVIKAGKKKRTVKKALR